MTTPTLDITLLGRTYSVACPPEERDALLEAAALLDTRMNELAKTTRSTGERLAVMAALNLAHELTTRGKTPAPPSAASAAAVSSFDTPDPRGRIRAMEARLDAALAQQEDLF